MVDVLEVNLEVINRLIRWSQRMLSLVDLIKLNTIPLELAAYLIEGIQNGASILIGARPSGAGKTTLMGALLGTIPSSDRIITIENARQIPQLSPGTWDSPKTYIIHEIGRSHHYLWGPPVVEATRLVDPNTRLMTNLHADSIEAVRATFHRFGSEKAINVFNFIIFIRHDRRNPPRVVDVVWKFDKPSQSHKRIYTNVGGFSQDFYDILNSQKSQDRMKWEKFLSMCLSQDILQVEEVAYALNDYARASV